MRAVLPLLLLCSIASQMNASAPDLAGRWVTIDEESGEAESVVEITVSSGVLNGTIVRLFDDPEQICDACSGELEGRPILGMRILRGLSFSDGRWTGGTILDPGSGREYDCSLWLDGRRLKVRGYLGPFYRTQRWRRAE